MSIVTAQHLVKIWQHTARTHVHIRTTAIANSWLAGITANAN
jgi:hypothetical protein